MNFDFNDPEIRDMVQDNHVPEDIWLHNDGVLPEVARLMAIRCIKCRCDWPCPTIVALRIWKKNRDEEREQQLEADYEESRKKGIPVEWIQKMRSR